MPKLTTDQEADRIMALLDSALASVRDADAGSAILALQEAEETAKRLPKKPDVIALPDQSKEART